jgi:iron complex transport system ATP-binding protein
MHETRLRAEDLSFSYGPREILRHLSIELQAGQILCLLGPNGCGKTTLLRCLNGLLTPASGQVWLGNERLSQLDETRRAQLMGFVFQERPVLFPYSVMDMVCMGRTAYLGLFAKPSAEDTQISIHALEMVGILHLKDKRYNEISGGERQLALLARALAQQPQVLLLDEPTSHLDFGNQVIVLSTIQRLCEQTGLAVAMATHFPEHAMRLAHTVALMKGGVLMTSGAPESVLTEENLRQLYGVDVRVISTHDAQGLELRTVAVMLGGRSNALRDPDHMNQEVKS